MAYEDRNLTCQDCGQTFVFSADDQAYHAEKGYENDPKRCQSCRQSRRGERSPEGSGYGRPREMFPIVCGECGKEAEVPFQPRGDRPVYCSDCYSKQRVSSPRRY